MKLMGVNRVMKEYVLIMKYSKPQLNRISMGTKRIKAKNMDHAENKAKIHIDKIKARLVKLAEI